MKGWRNTIVGTGLVIFGLLLLIDQLTNARLFGRLFLLVLGAGFIAAAHANRAPGLTVPGGILSGVGLGSLAMNAFRRGFTGPARGGAFLICLALGWLIIVPTSRAAGESYSWAYVPAVILAAVGIPLLLTALAPSVVAAALKWWPSVLILAGILMLLRRDTN